MITTAGMTYPIETGEVIKSQESVHIHTHASIALGKNHIVKDRLGWFAEEGMQEHGLHNCVACLI